MRLRLTVKTASIVASLASAAGLGLAVSPTIASAAPNCAKVEAVFARGTVETAPPLGVTGIAFTNSLRSQLGGRSLHVHPVNYPASSNFTDRVNFARNVVKGITDTQNRVKDVATQCPNTRIVIGGYSQGAVVAQFATADNIVLPAEYRQYASYIPKPLPASVASHVAAVVLFAPPSKQFLRDARAPHVSVGSAYVPKTRSFCIPGDVVCDGAHLSAPNGLHVLYSVNGDAVTGARYAAARV